MSIKSEADGLGMKQKKNPEAGSPLNVLQRKHVLVLTEIKAELKILTTQFQNGI